MDMAEPGRQARYVALDVDAVPVPPHQCADGERVAHVKEAGAVAQGQFVLSKNFRRNNRLGSMLDLAAQMG